MKAFKLSNYSVGDYLRIEQETGEKYEYHDGEIFAMAGGTLPHTTLCGNAYFELESALRTKGKNCKTFTSEAKVHIQPFNKYMYPDASVVCGEVETADENKHAITNPVLLVGVLSEKSADYDRGDKFHMYQKIESFQEYVLIQQDAYVVDLYYRHADSDLWKISRVEGLDQDIELESIGVSISMNDLYRNVTFDESQSDGSIDQKENN